MNAKDKIVLLKIVGYIKEALLYTGGKSFNDFSADSKTVNATAFVLGQIGELVKLISDETQKANPEIQWRGIRGLRNRIVHDYESIDMTMFWEVIRDDLPELERQMQELLKQK
jgi:uncharacterized protein with HEPN domain